MAMADQLKRSGLVKAFDVVGRGQGRGEREQGPHIAIRRNHEVDWDRVITKVKENGSRCQRKRRERCESRLREAGYISRADWIK
jgi:hypothetical protein